MNEKIKEYINKQPSPQKEICSKVRNILFDAVPEVQEEFKNGVPWYGKFYIAGLKNSVNIGFSIIGLDKEKLKLFEGNGKFMRHIKIHSKNGIDEKKLKKLFKLVWSKASCYE